MAQEPNPFELLQPKPQWGGMPALTPQEQGGAEGGFFQQVDPAVMQMMWAPPPKVPPPPQIQPPL